MNRSTCIVLWISLVVCGTAASAAETIRWAPDLPSAQAAAQKFRVPLLIHFFGDHCLPCELVDRRVFQDPEVINTLNKYFICVRVNASAAENRQLVATYQIMSWPTDVFLSPDGKKLYQGISPTTADGYLAVLRNVAILNRNRLAMLASQEPAGEASTSPLTARTNQSPSGIGSQSIYAQSNPSTSGAPTVEGVTPPAFPATSPVTVTTTPSQPSGAAPSGSPFAADSARAPTAPLNVAGNPTADLGGAKRSPQAEFATETPGNADFAPPASSASATTSSAAAPAFAGVPSTHRPADTTAVTSSTLSRGFMSAAATRGATASPTRLASQSIWHSSQGNAPASITIEVPDNQAAQAAITEPTGTGSAELSHHQPDTNSEPASAHNSASLWGDVTPALSGYCPVTLTRETKWVKGSREFAVKHRGKVYFMASAAKMQAFLQSPDRYSPVLAGFDPVVYLEEGKLIPGQLQYGLQIESNGRFLLFSTEENKNKYWDAFDRYQEQLTQVLSKAKILP